ncbi:hypothetical protein CDL12_05000 [Handroanthus impetiginosus]|uniref:DUF3511 domain-containing protein n=1 Tax=Handroanthus impetiginosus TaxID=429701 RepID=A0A2G9HXP5_9LAMI|nr:hypothetical protein CDL12_05000 [Handroanthus impetiginosus]
MEKFSRSKSSRENGMQMQPKSMNGLRSYSSSSYNYPPRQVDYTINKVKIKKENKKSINGSFSKNWSFNLDPELQRKKRVAGYKAFAMEGKMKGSLKRSFKWIKDTCDQVVHGFW